MARVVCVHGVGQQRETENTLHQAWAPALCGGVGLAGGRLTEAEVRCAFYGDLFRPPGRHLAGGDPLIRAEDLDQFEQDLLAAWWDEAARTDAAVVAPDARTLAVRTPRGVQSALRALSGSRFFAALGERALLGDLRQVRDYLHKPEVRQEARQRVAAAVGEDTRVLVGHSLGSVVAYEALCANPEWPVRMLVTLGSPLGIPNLIFDRLQPAPLPAALGRAGSAGPVARSGAGLGERRGSGRRGGSGQGSARRVRAGGGLLGGGQRRDCSRCQAVPDRGGDRAGHRGRPGWHAAGRQCRRRPLMDTVRGNRFLLTAAMTRYPRDPELDRPELVDDVERIAGLFTTDFGYTHLRLPGDSPTQAQLRDGLRDFCKAPERGPDDFVAVYLACHGAILEPDDFVLLPSDIDPDDLVPLAVTPQVLVDWLLRDTNVRRLLLMLDTCYSGQGGQDAAGAAVRWVNQPGAADRPGVVLVTATHPWQEAQPGVFSRAFERAVGHLATGGYAQEDLPLDAVVEVINADRGKPASQTVTCHELGKTGLPPPFLPNPRYRPRLIDVDLLEQERARHAEQREAHLRDRFLPATRWFTGRHAALTDLAAWLNNPLPPPARWS